MEIQIPGELLSKAIDPNENSEHLLKLKAEFGTQTMPVLMKLKTRI